MTMRRDYLAFLFLLVVAPHVGAQVVGVQPPNPTSRDAIVLRVSAPQPGFILQPITVNGSNVDITFRGGSIFPSAESHDVALPPLGPGTYAVNVTFVFLDAGGNLDHVVTLPPFSLAVLPGSVPSLDAFGVLVLLAALGAAGVVSLRRW